MTLLTTLTVVGLIDSWYIFYKKQKKEKLVCFVGQGEEKGLFFTLN